MNDRSLPGLYLEMEEHLIALGVKNLKNMSKYSYKRKVRAYVKQKDREELLNEIRGYKKLDVERLSGESFERKSYFDTLNLDDARMRIRIEARLVPTILGNYPSKHRRRGKSLACPMCLISDEMEKGSTAPRESSPPSPPLHSQSHLLSGQCEGVRDLLDDCEPRDDQSLVTFFRRVMARNLEVEELHEL